LNDWTFVAQKRMKRRLFRDDIVARRTVQPATIGIDESWFLRSRGEIWQEGVENTALNLTHRTVEVTS